MRKHVRSSIKPGRFRPSLIAEPILSNGNGAWVEVLSSEDQGVLTEISQFLTVAPHTVLYQDKARADFVYNIVGGVAQSYLLLRDGSRRVIDFSFRGDLLGLSENGSYLSTAESITTLFVYRTPIASLREMLQRSNRFNTSLLAKAAQELRNSQRHNTIMGKKEASARLSAFLLGLCRTPLKTVSHPLTLWLPMTRSDIADYLGLSHETVSRALGSLEREQIIVRTGSRLISVLDKERLHLIADDGTP